MLLKSGNGSGQCRFYVGTAPGDELVYYIYYIKVRMRARCKLLLPVCYLTCWLVPAGRLTVGAGVAGRVGMFIGKCKGLGGFCGLFFGNFGIFSYLCDLKEQYADSCYLKPDKFLHTRRHGWFFTSWREGKLYLCVRALSGPQIRDVAIRSRYFYV